MKPVIESLERRCLLDGTLDPSYGSGGMVFTSFRNTTDAVSMAFQDDGKQIVVGTTDQPNVGKDIFVARYDVGGMLDTTFGTGGVTFLDLGADDIATTVKIQSDGKVVAAGTTGNTSGTLGDAWVGRWTMDGRLDTTFNRTGYRVLDFGGLDAVSGLLLDGGRMDSGGGTSSGDSGIVLAGASANPLGLTSSIVVAKLQDSGMLDYGFGPGTGIFLSSPGRGTFEGATSLSRFGSRYLVSGFQLAAATQTSRFMVGAIDCDCGYFDDNFGVGGRAFAGFGNNIELAMDARYDPYINRIYAVGVTGDGLTDPLPGLPKLSVGGVASSSQFAIARFLVNGQLDTSFNGAGTNTLDFPGYKAGASGLAIQGDGRLIAGGGAQSLSTGLSDFAFGRFNPDGMLDTTFRNEGRLVQDLGASDGAFRLFQRRGDFDSFYAIGHSKFNATSGRLALLRYLVASSAFGIVPPILAISNLHRVAAPVNGMLDFRVRLSHAPTTPLTVHYATRDGLSRAGTDYDATFGELTFNPGERSKTISVPYHDSHNGAMPGSFHIDLSDPSSGAMLANPTGTASLRFLAPNLNQVRIQSIAPIGFPKNIVAGQKTTTTFARVTVRNFGKKLVKGSQLLKVYGSTDRRLDPGSDKIMGKLKANLSLAPGKSQSFKVPVVFPAAARDTQYHLLGTASGAGVLKAAANVARAKNPFLVTTPAVTLIGSSKARPGVAFAFGQKGEISFPLTNTGTIATTGTATIVLNITTNGTLAGLRYFYFPKTVPINIAPGKTSTIPVKITAPAGNLGLAAGNYVMLVILKSTKLQYKNTTDGTLVATIPFTLG